MDDRQQINNINISVIIPHYNDFEGLFRLVKSIPIENDIEILVIDDHSKKGVYDQILTEYEVWKNNRNIYLYQNEEANSAGTCRNIGLKNASGKWILFADADDYFAEGFFTYAKEYIESKSDIIYFRTDSYDVQKEVQSVRHLHFNKIVDEYRNNPSEISEMEVRLLVVPWGKLIRKKMIDDNDIWFEEVRYSNDVMFSTLSGIYAKKVEVDPRIAYIITEKPGTLTRIYTKESFDIRKCVLIRRHVFLHSHLSRKMMKQLGMKWQGVRYIFSPIRNGYGVALAIKYYKMLRKEKAPLVIL